MVAGLTLQAIGLAWIAVVTASDTPFSELIVPFVLTGTGMALIFPTAAETVLASVGPREAEKASGANNAIREVGGVMGVAVLASVFAAQGGYESPQAFTDGVIGALPIAVVVLAAGAVLAVLVLAGGARPRPPPPPPPPARPSPRRPSRPHRTAASPARRRPLAARS